MSTDRLCPRCGAPLTSLGTFALLPGDDVPESGARTEVLVTPTRVLRVTASGCVCGHVELIRAVPPTPHAHGARR